MFWIIKKLIIPIICLPLISGCALLAGAACGHSLKQKQALQASNPYTKLYQNLEQDFASGNITKEQYNYYKYQIALDELRAKEQSASQDDAMALSMLMGMQNSNLQKRQTYHQPFQPIVIPQKKTFTIKPKYLDLNPHDGLMDAGTVSNPYIAKED